MTIFLQSLLNRLSTFEIRVNPEIEHLHPWNIGHNPILYSVQKMGKCARSL
jgi:hypothetical protein